MIWICHQSIFLHTDFDFIKILMKENYIPISNDESALECLLVKNKHFLKVKKLKAAAYFRCTLLILTILLPVHTTIILHKIFFNGDFTFNFSLLFQLLNNDI